LVPPFGQALEPKQEEAPDLPHLPNGLKTKQGARAWSRLLSRRSSKDEKPKYDQSLFKAIFKTFFYQIWTAGILKLLSGKFQD